MEFNKENIIELADRYPYLTSDVAIEKEVKQWLKTNKYLNKELFIRLCCWKSPRPKRHYIKNEERKIIEVTRLAFSTNNEKERIASLLTLYGVSYPVASTILHFASPDKYPIMDFRVIESLGWKKPSYYSFKFWEKYCNKIRELSKQYNLSIGTIDKALWTYSKENKRNCILSDG